MCQCQSEPEKFGCLLLFLVRKFFDPVTQVDLSIPLDMINKLAGEVRGMKEEQLQR